IVATYVDELQVSYTIQEVNDLYVGLEFWYKFNEGIGATEIIDHSGKSRHLDVVNSTGVNAAWNGVGTTEAVEGDYMGGTGANPDSLGGTYWTT
ncbi:hypothetical protein, partial [Mesorhizobium sp. WSM4884]|uniref:hypothetical protein n=1 Tax=Mesorhizobium sp. WSM4884 TaxID=3038542 RepID=UPI002416FA51